MQRWNASRPCEDDRRSCAERLSIECAATHAALPGRRRAAHGRVCRRLADHASRAPNGARAWTKILLQRVSIPAESVRRGDRACPRERRARSMNPFEAKEPRSCLPQSNRSPRGCIR
ncbi:conserved hypothetical protein [Burkholderia pseudomallei 668]|nr:conserved hypothetical protein [Burkholderia pseudomallei 668]